MIQPKITAQSKESPLEERVHEIEGLVDMFSDYIDFLKMPAISGESRRTLIMQMEDEINYLQPIAPEIAMSLKDTLYRAVISQPERNPMDFASYEFSKN